MMNAGLIARTGLETHSDNTIMPRSPHRYRQPFIEASRAANRSVRRVERDNTIPAPVDCSNFRAAPQEERHCCCSEVRMSPCARNRNVPLSWRSLRRSQIGTDGDEYEGIDVRGGGGAGEGGDVEPEIGRSLAASGVSAGEARDAALSSQGREGAPAWLGRPTVESRAAGGGAAADSCAALTKERRGCGAQARGPA